MIDSNSIATNELKKQDIRVVIPLTALDRMSPAIFITPAKMIK